MSNGIFKFVQINMKHLLYHGQLIRQTLVTLCSKAVILMLVHCFAPIMLCVWGGGGLFLFVF